MKTCGPASPPLRGGIAGGPGSPPRAWAATVDTDAWYVLVNRNSGKALDVSGASTGDGARAGQWTRVTTWTKGEIWRFFAQFQ